MQKTFTEFSTNALLKIGDESLLESFNTTKPLDIFAFIRTGSIQAEVLIDDIPITIVPNSILALSSVQYFKFIAGDDLKVYLFNREFYCIKDHDQEVGCAGLLFFGDVQNPIVHLNKQEQEKFDMLHDIFIDELDTKDTIQAEMLRMLMARFIIKATRLLKDKAQVDSQDKDVKIELLRNFNVMVETHFRAEHSVQFYADTLFKSPKTLSNTFAKYNKSPLKIIHERIVLEAKRLLMYTNKSTKEIAYDLGFEDASHLSRLFKKHTGLAPSEFKKDLKITS